MIYSIDYRPASGFKYYDEADELKIKYRHSDTTLPDFIEKYKDKQIVIILTSENFHNEKKAKEVHERIYALYQEYKNIKLSLPISPFLGEEVFFDIKNNIPFFYNFPISSWDVLHKAIADGVSDVLIYGELAFDLKKVRSVVGDIQIRVYPNIAQSTNDMNIPLIKKFFIRPEDLDVYAQYVDVIEFFTFKNIDYSNVIWEIYTKDKKWFGNMSEYILGCDEDIDNRCILSAFAEYRVKCGKRCFKGDSCNICDRVVDFADTLANENMIITNKNI